MAKKIKKCKNPKTGQEYILIPRGWRKQKAVKIPLDAVSKRRKGKGSS